MNKELKHICPGAVIRVEFRFPWRKKPEPVIIGIIDHFDDQHGLVYVNYPACLVDVPARELNINRPDKRLECYAKTCGIYYSYEYTVKPLTVEEVMEWYDAVSVFHKKKCLNDIVEGHPLSFRLDVPDTARVYVGEEIYHPSTYDDTH